MSELYRALPEVTPLSHMPEKSSLTPEKDFELDLTVERLKRHLEIADLIDDLEGDKPLGDKRAKISAIIEGRGWNTLFESLKKGGDDVAVFIVPTGAYAIKHLNDVIFGPQGADDIIEHQKMFLRTLMTNYGFTCLKQDYKTSFFKVNGATPEVLDMIAATVQAQLDLYVQQKITTYTKQHQAKGQSADHLATFRQAVKTGYTLAYGLTSAQSGSFEDVERVVLEGTQKAKYFQLRNNRGGRYGGEYNAQEIVATADRTQIIRTAILEKYHNTIVDDTGARHVVFEDPHHTGQFQLNRYVLRALRKGILRPKTERDGQIVRLLDEYKQIINLLDVGKPFTHNEVVGEATSGVNLHNQLTEELTVARSIASTELTLDTDCRTKAAAILKRDQKDGQCTSPAVFHRSALETTPHCTYISIDVLDVGVDLLLEYEQLYQTIEQARSSDKKKCLQAAMAQAGDKKTLELRAIRERVKRYCAEKFSSDIPMLVGGDEITLALDSALVDEDFLFGLRAASGSRVVTSEVARATISDTSPENKEELYRLHALAIKEGQAAISIAKKIEEMMAMRDQGIITNPAVTDPALTALFGELKKGFVVKEERGVYYLIIKGEELPLTLDHGRISVAKNGAEVFIYGATLVLLLAFFAIK